MAIITKYKDSDGSDLGSKLIEKSYIIENYPHLLPNLKSAGLWTWGYGSSGSLGTGVSNVFKSSPVQTVAGGTNWKQVVGDTTVLAIKTDGTLWGWGSNLYGTIGDNTVIHRSSPVQNISTSTEWKQVSCMYDHVAAIKTDGTLWLWGNNTDRQLGDGTGTSAHKSSPVQTFAGGTNWKSVSAGYRYNAAIKNDGTLWTWGFNAWGKLGSGTSSSTSLPAQTVSATTNWASVHAGKDHTAAIKTDGTLWLWGLNSIGALGDGTVTMRSSPVQTVGGGTNWKQVSCGHEFTAAIKTDGTLWTWGNNQGGWLGTGVSAGSSHRSSPGQTISGGTNWYKVSCGAPTTTGDYSVAAIKTDSTLWTWGSNTYGTLGDNTVSERNSPVQTAASGSNWKSVSVGSVMFAIRDFDEA